MDAMAELGTTEVVSGGCRGIDREGVSVAGLHDIPISVFPADWKKHGRAAGPIRNKEMACYADSLILIWDGKSRGSNSMRNIAIGKGLTVKELIV